MKIQLLVFCYLLPMQQQKHPLPSDFVAYDSLTSSKVLGWVTTALGSDKVTAIETDLEAEVTEAITPTTAAGVPW